MALYGHCGDGQASLATRFAAVAAPQYSGGVFVWDGRSTAAMWKDIRRVVLSKGLCSDAERAELDDMDMCFLFLKWLACERGLCLFVVTHARFVNLADLDCGDDLVSARCGALPWLLSHLRNTSNLHILFTTTASRVVTVRVSRALATISLGASGDQHAEAVMKMLASVYSLTVDSVSGLPKKPAGCPICGRLQFPPQAHYEGGRAGSAAPIMAAQAVASQEAAQGTAVSGRQGAHDVPDALA